MVAGIGPKGIQKYVASRGNWRRDVEAVSRSLITILSPFTRELREQVAQESVREAFYALRWVIG